MRAGVDKITEKSREERRRGEERGNNIGECSLPGCEVLM